MSTVVTQAEFCATTVTQADYSSAASSAVSPNDFRRAWITPNPDDLTGLAERSTNQNQYAGVKLTVNDANKLSSSRQQHLQPPSLSSPPSQQQQQQQQPAQQQLSVDHDDEVALHPLSNQVYLKMIAFL